MSPISLREKGKSFHGLQGSIQHSPYHFSYSSLSCSLFSGHVGFVVFLHCTFYLLTSQSCTCCSLHLNFLPRYLHACSLTPKFFPKCYHPRKAFSDRHIYDCNPPLTFPSLLYYLLQHTALSGILCILPIYFAYRLPLLALLNSR